jgi:pSer/pThr/pTyr-binding forkhead associated (FHA) protein
MALRFRVLPSDDTRPAGVAAAGPLVVRDVELPEHIEEIRVGRRADVELPLPFAVLSGVHARLARAEAGWVVEDLGSTNGTWLDGARLPPGERRALAPGAELRLGTVRVRFEGVGPTGPEGHGTATIARRLVDDLFGSGGAAPTLRVVRGAPQAEVSLAVPGRAYVAGRGEACALRLPVEEVSREHASFARGADGVLVRDLGSKNGVVVGGARVTGERALGDGDVVQIGPVTLTLDDPAARYLRELERQPAEPEPEPTPVPPPSPTVTPPEVVVLAAPARKRLGSAQLVVGLAASVLLLLAVAATVVFWPTR